MISEQVLARVGDECRESRDELERVEDEVGCPVAPRVVQLVDDLAFRREREALGRDRGTGDINRILPRTLIDLPAMGAGRPIREMSD